MKLLALIIAALVGFSMGFYFVKWSMPLCEDGNGLILNEKKLCYLVGDGFSPEGEY